LFSWNALRRIFSPAKSVGVAVKAINIGICGYKVLQQNRLELSRRVGREVHVTHIGSRRLREEQNIGDTRFSLDVMSVVNDPQIDIVLELLGGTELARDVILSAIANGKHVVTANKALIALHGNEVFSAAAKAKVVVAYEAAVAGGIPIIKAIREGLAGNSIQWLAGIINGTGNFILTEMREKQRTFVDALKEAQELGYAEADPSFDVDGIDAAHKLTILASIAFGIPLQFGSTYIEGIRHITQEDVRNAQELGYRIKHLGISRRTASGFELRVHPALLDKDTMLANVNGVMNAVMVNGDAVGSTLYYGAGAGASPTASAVVADIVDVARMISSPELSVPALAFQDEHLSDQPILPIHEVESANYLRITAQDKAGVLSDITEILGDFGINIEAIIQKEPENKPESRVKEASTTQSTQKVPVIILTRPVSEATMNAAIEAIEALEAVGEDVVRLRVFRTGEE
jgi:homoserine dehydrogenase